MGNVDHITNEISIQGKGPVDGAPEDLSSVRGELQGQMAMALISHLLLQAHNDTADHHTDG